MKIVLVCNEYPPKPHGGIGTFVYTLAHGMYGKGHSVTVVGVGERNEYRDDNGVRVITIGAKRQRFTSWFWKRWKLTKFLRDEARRGNLDIIEVPDYLGLLPFQISECPIIVRLHNTATAMARHRRVNPGFSNLVFERRSLKIHRNWIAVSNHALDFTLLTFRGITPIRFRVIYSPVESRCEDISVVDRPAFDDFVLFVGHVTARKGAICLAKAARTFLLQFPNLHLVYAGGVLHEDDVAPDEVIRRLLGPELGSRCHFLGFVAHATILSYMKYARALALPSTIEMFPLVVNEAMLQGCPVIVSNIAPFTEFVIHERTGLLVDPNRPDLWAASISRLLSDRVLAANLSAAGKDFVQRTLMLNKHVKETEEFYEECRFAHRN